MNLTSNTVNSHESHLGIVLTNGSRKICILAKYIKTLNYAYFSADNSKISIYDHTYHLSRFFNKLRESGWHKDSEITLSANICTEVDLLVFLDAPTRFLYKKIQKIKARRKVLVCSEHPYYQANLQEFANSSDMIISPYKLFGYSNLVLSTTSFVFSEIPGDDITNSNFEDKKFDASIICSNLLGPPNSMYNFRRHLINLSSLLMKSKFAFWGRYWDLKTPKYKKTKNPVKLFRTYNSIRKVVPLYNTSPMGEIKDKQVLKKCFSTYAIENFCDLPGYITEKAFEPLIYNCIPIYVGSNLHDAFKGAFKNHQPCSMSILNTVNAYSNMSTIEVNSLALSLRNNLNSIFSSHNGKTSLMHLFEVIENVL